MCVIYQNLWELTIGHSRVKSNQSKVYDAISKDKIIVMFLRWLSV